MEENNNQPVTPVNTEAEPASVHSVPSLVIEDTAPETPAPAMPAAPAMPEAPAVVETPVTTDATVNQVQAEVKPAEVTIEPQVSNQVNPSVGDKPIEVSTDIKVVNPVGGETPAAPETPVAQPAQPQAAETKPEKKNHNTLAIIVIIVCVIATAVYLITKNSSQEVAPTPTPTPTPGNVTPGNNVDTNSLSLNQASYKGTTFAFPESVATFTNVGWRLNNESASATVEPGMSTSGGRVGTAPGGAILMVINKTDRAIPVERCTVYSAVFFNPKDGSEAVTFVGGLGYTSTIDNVKTKMTELGYANPNENVNENTSFLRYFLNDDVTNTSDYIEFYFVDGLVETVTISTAV